MARTWNSSSTAHACEDPPVATESLPSLFTRFLRFGLLAWGGPVAQIAMLREELVDREQWVDSARFNRVLGIYQALPGPEATELCMYFGQLRRGRLGGLVAGIAFLLPGLLLMLALTGLYVAAGRFGARVDGALLGMEVAAVALVARGAWKIGSRALPDRTTIALALLAAVATVAGVHFAIVLLGCGALLELARRWRVLGMLAIGLLAAAACALAVGELRDSRGVDRTPDRTAEHAGEGTLLELGASGLQAGALTFGGAYTVIPFLRQDAVDEHGWLTDSELLQGLSLGSVLPAPLIIFATFVGWLAGGGLAASLLMTAAIFFPAFAITFAGHRVLERIVDDPRVHDVLDGITAGVVGLISVTAVQLALQLVDTAWLAAVLAASCVALWRWSSPLGIPAVMAGAALVGIAAAY
jgi:chromate transporter